MSGAQQKERWGVLGGGVLGMTLALRLRQRDREVVLCEAGERLGGLASAWSLGNIVWDRHYHVILGSDSALRKLLRELELEKRIEWVETRTGFYTEGHLYSLSNTWEFLRFPPLNLWDKMRLGATIVYASRIRDSRSLENIPVSDWLRRWSGAKSFRKMWLPLLRAKLGDHYSRASAAFIWAIIARMYSARRSGMKKEMFGYVHGGYARILDRLESVLRKEQVDVRTRHAVKAIYPEDGGITVQFESAPAERFDRVVATMASPIAAKVCRGLSEDEYRRLNGVEYQGIICASMLLRRPLANYYVTNITEPWVPFTAVIEMSALVNRQELSGWALVYLPKYVSTQDPAFDIPDDEIQESFLTALERMYPNFRREEVKAFRISRARYVMPIATLNYSDHLPPMRTSVPGIYLVNSAHIVNGTLNVNETVQLAEGAVMQLLQDPVDTQSDQAAYEAKKTVGQSIA